MSTQVEATVKGIVKGNNEIPTCHGGLENLDEEHSYTITDIEGDLPSDLTGTFFRNDFLSIIYSFFLEKSCQYCSKSIK